MLAVMCIVCVVGAGTTTVRGVYVASVEFWGFGSSLVVASDAKHVTFSVFMVS